jgi:hypothetical protein
MNPQSLHVHVYDQASKADDNLVAEIDLELIDVYDSYLQFGFERNGEWFEIRVPRS